MATYVSAGVGINKSVLPQFRPLDFRAIDRILLHDIERCRQACPCLRGKNGWSNRGLGGRYWSTTAECCSYDEEEEEKAKGTHWCALILAPFAGLLLDCYPS